MELIKLLRREWSDSLKLILTVVVISGAANAGLVALINAGASATHQSTVAVIDFLMFTVALAIYLYTQNYSEKLGRVVMENAMSRQRARIYEKIQNASLTIFESLGRSEMIAKTNNISSQILQSSDSVIFGLQSCVMMLFCFVYLFTLSGVAMLVVLSGVGALFYIRILRDRKAKDRLEDLIAKDERQSHLLGDMIEGFKQLKINQTKRLGLMNDFLNSVETVRILSISTGKENILFRVITQGSFFILLGLIVFVVPRFIDSYTRQVMEITSVVLFIIGYLSGLVQVIPVFTRTNAALRNMENLETLLDASVEKSIEIHAEQRKQYANFQSIEMQDLGFAYPSDHGDTPFTVGPINLKIQRGEIVFLTGGNGSGKSTFLKLLSGLYLPQSGQLVCGDQIIGVSNLQYWRDLFSVIFTDFYLFERLYGYENADPAYVSSLLKTMRLDELVTFKDGCFSNLKLSTGQRKRLALVAAMVEDKEIYIFDEWAADQDPHFRNYFYKTILGDLRQSGKTVVVVTHDDAYWHCADRLIKLQHGQVQSADKGLKSAEIFI
jgi:putative ATP-binding cassette transporter